MSESVEFNTSKVRLGDYIEQRREKNDNFDVPKCGVTRDGFIPPKQDEADTSMYNVFYRNDFVFNPARMELNSIALNTQWDKAICSSLYEIFFIKDTSVLLPEYLNLFLKRDEFARYCGYDAIGSARNYFRISNMQDIMIPLPSIVTQREIVSVYEGLQKVISENESIIKPLEKSCRAFIVDCQKRYPKVKLEDWIIESDERNQNLSVHLSQGISNLKYFQNPKQVAENSKSDKIVRTGQFAYNRATTRNGEKISIAYRDGEDCTVSSSYGVFSINNEEQLNPKYLMLLFRRAEFDRYARWRSEGSAHEFFTFEMMQNVMIPFPPKEIQDSIVDLFRCLENARDIISESRKVMKTLCPALIQKAAHSA